MGTERNRQPGSVPDLPLVLGYQWRLDVTDAGEFEVQVLNRSTGRWERKLLLDPTLGPVVI